MSAAEPVDIFIIGGGVNGCGIARDAAGRGHSVILAEKDDLASGTSSGSTKLIHGGLRYLEYYEFRLVRESLKEREVLWAMAPHIVSPLRFILPLHRAMRPAWLIRLGLFLYDHIGGRKRLAPTRTLDLTADVAGGALKPAFKRAFEYSDCWVDDARLVVLNARSAADLGATVLTRSTVVDARRADGLWRVTIKDALTGARKEFAARLLVNAAGPWIDAALRSALGRNGARNIRLVQGSHIVVRKKFAHGRAYFFQNNDGRIFFGIPYEDDFTLIGTTDRDWPGEPGGIHISADEIDYLCAGASEYFREPVTRADIVWTYSAVRPLYDDGASKAQEATRDYVLKMEDDGAPLINVFGGKITTYRRLAEAVMEKIEGVIPPKGRPWTEGAALPGGDFPVDAVDARVVGLCVAFPFLAPGHARRLVRLYGTEAHRLLAGVDDASGLGRHFGADLFEVELRWLMDREWAVTAEDVLWRRTKLGLRFSPAETAALDDFIHAARTGVPAGRK
ncbi:MAG: glycerol-3-phosphate dehydrogenase [Phyllobacteriaceae bacterium]|nr:glycerol-3-phosphate dehydrogenase [Phyllobacteriaceae bacterium]